jgi:hypothetical protein
VCDRVARALPRAAEHLSISWSRGSISGRRLRRRRRLGARSERMRGYRSCSRSIAGRRSKKGVRMSTFDDQRDALKVLLERAATDWDFRQALLEDPARAILEATGTVISIRVKFVEKDPDVDLQIVLPDFVACEPELSVDELDIVAGGTNWCLNSCQINSEE